MEVPGANSSGFCFSQAAKASRVMVANGSSAGPGSCGTSRGSPPAWVARSMRRMRCASLLAPAVRSGAHLASGCASLTVPSAVRWASISPVKALVIEPSRRIVSPSGAGLPWPARSPKPLTDVCPSRMAPMTTAGTLVSRMKTCPVKVTISSSRASARANDTVDATPPAMIVATSAPRQTTRDTLLVIRRPPVIERDYAPSDVRRLDLVAALDGESGYPGRQVQDRAGGQEIVDVREHLRVPTVLDPQRECGAQVGIDRVLPHEPSAPGELDDLARFVGVLAHRGIGIGDQEVAIRGEDQTQRPVEVHRILVDDCSGPEVCLGAPCTVQREDGVVLL